MDIEKVSDLLSRLDPAPVECDGFCRLASTLLHHHNVYHQVYYGEMTSRDGGHIPLHFWLVVGDVILDYRARMWLGDGAPHGMVDDSSGYQYYGSPASIEPLPDTVFQILSGMNVADFV